MKWTTGPAALASCVLLLTACGSNDASSGSAGEGAITLRVVSGLSDQHAWWSAATQPWTERVTELTGGKVTFEAFTGGELVETPDEADAVLNGAGDVGLMLPIYTPDQFKMSEVTMLPVSHSDSAVGSEAWKNLLESDVVLSNGKTYYEEEYGDKGLKVFPVSVTEPYVISTTGKELESAGAVDGLSLRTPSRIHTTYAENTGMDTVSIPAVEMFDSLSRGAFDGSFYSIADWSGYGFQDLFEYTVTDINYGHFNAVLGMTEETWESLAPEYQKAFTQAADEILVQSSAEWMTRTDKMIELNTENGGEFVPMTHLPREVQDRLLAGVEETWSDYAALLEDDGLPGNDLARLWRDLIVQAGGSVPDSIAALD